MDGYKVIRGSGVSMTSPEGSVLLASMFGDTFGPDDVEVFPIELPVGFTDACIPRCVDRRCAVPIDELAAGVTHEGPRHD